MSYVCQTKCYYKDTLWSVGDRLPDGIDPNKHFVETGSFKKTIPPPKLTAGDDPRPTSLIIKRLNEVYGLDIADSTPRKEAWRLEREMDRKGGEAIKEQRKEKTTTENKDGKEKEVLTQDPAALTPFCKMLPDELQAMTIKEIAAHCTAKYGVEVKVLGINKATLIKKVVDIENDHQEAVSDGQSS